MRRSPRGCLRTKAAICPPPSQRHCTKERAVGARKSLFANLLFTVADYFLLYARVTREALEQQNQNRKQAYDRAVDGQGLRQKVKVAKDYIRSNPEAANKAIAAALKKAGTLVAATQLTLARSELSQRIQSREEKKLEDPREIPLYTPLYF